ncbi:Hypothetical predicted protein [Olea europaea subsp. europaea]|uniref:Protein TIFY n=3 Tax=Olea europaea subsp. europaea TaxID=158383 RepID=A0A8S0QX28_OLEEU|nr:Hypothetical predicted protein [Olea europaea subsp. europaea]
MGSSENVDSGNFSVKRSNFSQTCSRLSQYLKENGSFGDLNLGFTQNFESKRTAPTGTMNLLPMIEKSGQNSGADLNMPVKKSEQETAQMTIFYAGEVIVFDDFPADKAKEMMILASNSSAQNHSTTAFPPPLPTPPPSNMVQSPAESATNIVPTPAAPPLASDLPIARKNSISRFLEKRKERSIAKAPYQATEPSKPAKGEPWLGLGHRFPH